MTAANRLAIPTRPSPKRSTVNCRQPLKAVPEAVSPIPIAVDDANHDESAKVSALGKKASGPDTTAIPIQPLDSK